MTDMQPENSRGPNGPEQVPAQVTPNGERIPVLPSPEGGIESGAERFEQTAEASALAADAATVGVPTLPPAMVLDPAAVIAPASDSPLIAADEDVIEKEWVDRAKKIIGETKDDPFARSSRVNELQKAYLQKRYSKELGTSD